MSIPTEAYEAAAVAMFYQQVGLKPPYPLWDGADADEKDNCLNDAELALTAAAPSIQAAALRDAAEVVQEECYIRSGDCFCGSAAWLTARADQLEGKTK